MTHLRIEQSTGVIEEVNLSIISKLYELVYAGLDASSNLQGRLHTPISYKSEVLYLTGHFPDLFITSDDYAIEFEDPKMVTYLNSIGVGSNGMVTEALATAATIVANSANTEVTKFNELKYFNNITSSKNGWTGVISGNIRFYNWTALEEVDISNFISLGHVSRNGYEDTFSGCTALKIVTASDKLTQIGHRAFADCTNLEHITGLSGTILVSGAAFYNCSKLPDEDIANVEFEPAYNGTTLAGDEAFLNTNFTEITLSSNTTKIPSKMFCDCSNLETVNGLGSNITDYLSACFQHCTKFTGPIDFTNVTHIGGSAFDNSGLTGSVNLQHILTIDNGSNFNNTKITSVNYYNNTISGYSGRFEGCKDLITASGMLNVLSPRESMFNGCTSLTSVDINWSNVTNHTVPTDMFKNCSSLQSIDLTGATTINNYAFEGCTSLTQVTGTLSITDFGRSAFEGCSLLTTLNNISFPGITSLHAAVFKNCSNLTGELSFPNLTGLIFESGIRGSLFQGCSNITKLSFGHLETMNLGFTSTADAPFKNCTNLKIVDLGDSLTQFSNYNFQGCSNLKAVIINVPIPPTKSSTATETSLQSNFGNNTVNIYVPDTAVATYKSTSPYSYFVDHIKPLSEYNELSILVS